jgi:hypothetical protein
VVHQGARVFAEWLELAVLRAEGTRTCDFRGSGHDDLTVASLNRMLAVAALPSTPCL